MGPGLDEKAFHHAMETRSHVAGSVDAAQTYVPEIGHRLGSQLPEQAKGNPAHRLLVVLHIHVYPRRHREAQATNNGQKVAAEDYHTVELHGRAILGSTVVLTR